MTLTIESRKYYRARDGRKVGPMERRESAMRRKMYMACKTSGRCYLEDGNGAHGTWDVARKRDFDLIAEWSDEDAELTQIAEDRRDGPFVPVDLDEPETGMPSGDGLLEEIGRVTREILSASDTIKTWGELSDAEKVTSAVFECIEMVDELYDSDLAARARGQLGIKPEPKRETVTCNIYHEGELTHHITYDKIDGKPDCSSVRMEEV